MHAVLFEYGVPGTPYLTLDAGRKQGRGWSSGDTIRNSGGTGLCSTWDKPRKTSPESTQRDQPVNVRTLSPGRSAPADLKKDANGFDRPIALGLLLASGQVAFDRPGNFAIVGELALTGETRPIRESSRWPSRPSPRVAPARSRPHHPRARPRGRSCWPWVLASQWRHGSAHGVRSDAGKCVVTTAARRHPRSPGSAGPRSPGTTGAGSSSRTGSRSAAGQRSPVTATTVVHNPARLISGAVCVSYRANAGTSPPPTVSTFSPTA